MVRNHLIETLCVAFLSGPLMLASEASEDEYGIFFSAVQGFDGQQIYFSVQDKRGAIWFGSDFGLYRFNGHSTERFRYSPIRGSVSYNGGSHLYIKEHGDVIDFNPLTKKENFRYVIDSVKLGNSSCLLAEGDSLFVSFRNTIYICKEGSSEVYSEAAAESKITALYRTMDGDLLAGTADGICKVCKDSIKLILPTNSSVLAIADLKNPGQIIVGMRKGGIIMASLSDEKIISAYDKCNGKTMVSIRSFATDRSGNTWAASANGLYRLSTEGVLTEIPINGRHNSPVHSLTTDSKGDIWISTHYDGLLYQSATSEIHIGVIPLPDGNPPVKGVVENKDGSIWMATDGHGLWRYNCNVWSLLPRTDMIKFQRIFCFPGEDTVFASDWSGHLYSFDSRGQLLGTALLTRKAPDGIENVIWSMEKTAPGQYLVGTNDGVCLYSPGTEESINRKIEHTQGRVNKILYKDEHTVYFLSRNLDVWRDGSLVSLIQSSVCRVYDIAIDRTGTVWGYTDNGIVRIVEDDNIEFFRNENNEVHSIKTPQLIPLDETHILGSMSDEIFLINYGAKVFSRYGLKGCSTCLKLSDGSILEVTDSGLLHMNPSEAFPTMDFSPAVIDRITSDDIDLSFSGKAVLDHRHNNLSFETATYNYSSIESGVYEYRMDGLDREWHQFDLSDRIEFKNLRPGRYTFKVRSSTVPGEWINEDSATIRIKQVWYATKAALATWATIVFLIFAMFVRFHVNRKVMAEKLYLQEEENKRQASFFVNLSYKMRTPVNLVISQLEQYFKENGNRIKNVERLEEIYKNTKDLRNMIADYVKVESEAFEREPKEVKFVNSLTGVVERHIFEKEINVTILCKEMNMGKTKLSEITKEVTGMSPGEFIQDVKLRHAAQMLTDGNYRISEIADALGFSSVNYFGVRFKKKFGCTPSAYRKEKTDAISQEDLQLLGNPDAVASEDRTELRED